MKNWKRYFWWIVLPFVILVLSLGLVSFFNWEYERRLFAPSSTVGYTGPILLVLAIVTTFAASGLLFLMRLFWLEPGNKNRQIFIWLLVVPKGLCAVALILIMLSLVWLGPAAVAIYEQKVLTEMGKTDGR